MADLDPKELAFNQLITKLFREELAKQTTDLLKPMGNFKIQRALGDNNAGEALAEIEKEKIRRADNGVLESIGAFDWDSDKRKNDNNYEFMKKKWGSSNGLMAVINFMEKFEPKPIDGIEMVRTLRENIDKNYQGSFYQKVREIEGLERK